MRLIACREYVIPEIDSSQKPNHAPQATAASHTQRKYLHLVLLY